MKKNLKIIFPVGLQCSGKTTWSTNICQKDSNHFRVSLDDFRQMRGKYWLPEDESIIIDSAAFCAASALSNGKTVIFDAMNLSAKTRKGYLNHIEGHLLSSVPDYELEVIVKDFFTNVPLSDLFNRALSREDEKGITPEIIMQTFIKNKDNLPKDLVIHPMNDELRKAVIVDIDGTIADKGERSPYDWSKVGKDEPHKDVIRLVKMLWDKGYTPIFMSGRDSICRIETINWLFEHIGSLYMDGIDLNERLLMRKRGDQRKDSQVKFELFMNHVYGNFNTQYVIDDRDQVVSMWRNVLGLRCLQVAEGNF